jgi:hypothetical protein
MEQRELDLLIAKQAITEQIYRYCRAIDRMDYNLILTVWHPDGTVDFSDGTADPNYAPGPPPVPFKAHFDWAWPFRASFLTHSHQSTNILIDVDGDRAGSETTSISLLQKQLPDGRIQHNLFWGRWLDRWSRRDGRWAIDHRQAIMDCYAPYEFQAAPLNSPDGHSSRRDRNDPSYLYLRSIA